MGPGGPSGSSVRSSDGQVCASTNYDRACFKARFASTPPGIRTTCAGQGCGWRVTAFCGWRAQRSHNLTAKTVNGAIHSNLDDAASTNTNPKETGSPSPGASPGASPRLAPDEKEASTMLNNADNPNACEGPCTSFKSSTSPSATPNPVPRLAPRPRLRLRPSTSPDETASSSPRSADARPSADLGPSSGHASTTFSVGPILRPSANPDEAASPSPRSAG